MTVVSEGTLLWEPSEELKERCNMTRFMRFLAEKRGVYAQDYAELYRWSVSDVAGFWSAIAEYFEVIWHAPASSVVSGQMPAVRWFDGATLNYAEHALRRRDDALALIAVSESGDRTALSYAELSERVARARAGLRRLGVGAGDRVAGLLPNGPEAVIAFLACASLGAIWSSCSPEFGVKSVLERFQQIEPKVLFAVSGYTYGGRFFDRAAETAEIVDGLATLVATISVGEPARLRGAISLSELCLVHEPLSFEPVAFEHPLWILYSSGTTGLPKPIVQGHGGILLEHLKALALHCDLGSSDRFFWFTTTGWMMWNFLVSGLALGACLVLYDGSPAHPNLDVLWKLAEAEAVTYFGTSAPYLIACQKAGTQPRQKHDLSSLKSLGTTGAPLPAAGFGWVYSHVSADLLLASVSGGSDVCTAFVLSCPLLPVRAGEIQCRGLGASVEAYDELGRSVIDQVGELVLTRPLPSMPLCFWGDSDGSRLKESYFSVFPGVWRHGDWIKITAQGSCVIYGRSDSTLNRGGVRMGTAEFYGVVEALPEIKDSLVVDTGTLDDSAGKLWLFVVLDPGAALDDALRRRIRAVIKQELSPRHVPDEVRAVRVIPRTQNGKKLEVPVKRILLGAAPEKVLSQAALADSTALEPFLELAAELRAGSASAGASSSRGPSSAG